MPQDNIIPMPEPENDLQHQAMSWVVRLNSGEASKEDRQAFTHWVQQKEEHRQAFFAARKLWLQLGTLDGKAHANQVTSWDAPFAYDRLSQNNKPHRRLKLGLAFCAVIACLAWLQPTITRYITADYRTTAGELKTVTLTDGSTVYLNTHTMIAEHFTSTHRQLELLVGEAEFVVAQDKKRPFIVSAGSGKTQALGTRFVVNYSDDKVRVSVLEHSVEISSKHHRPVTLPQGFRLDYGEQGLLDIPKSVSATDTAWREGKLKFNAQPLSVVITEINRYLSGTIVLANTDYTHHQVSGVFEIKNLDSAISVIAQSLHLQTINIGTLLYVIY